MEHRHAAVEAREFAADHLSVDTLLSDLVGGIGATDSGDKTCHGTRAARWNVARTSAADDATHGGNGRSDLYEGLAVGKARARAASFCHRRQSPPQNAEHADAYP